MRAALLLALLGAGTAHAYTDTFTGDGADAPVGAEALSLTTLRASGDETVAADLLLRPDSGMQLRDVPNLTGRYGLTARDVLLELAPHLEAVQPVLKRSHASGNAVHEYYELHFGPYLLAPYWLHLHHQRNRLVMYRAQLPAFRLPPEPPRPEDFIPPDALGFGENSEHVTSRERQIITDSGGMAAPAWLLSRFDSAAGRGEELIIDAQTGALISSRRLGLPLATVFERNPQDGVLTNVDLPDLPGTGYLDGRNFHIYAPGMHDPRVMAPDNVFDFLPHDPADQLNFDQVQAYYGATRVLRWFQQRFGYPDLPVPMVVRVHASIRGSQDNAMYVPGDEVGEIQIGAGSGRLQNLARDTDVISHEFSHHIIYATLRDWDGESGVLHEGYADYFAYAVSGDPNLAESVVPAGGPLRTAALPAGDRYELIPAAKSTHFRGQYWSALLWDLRQTLGDRGDRVVYDSLAYLGPSSGIRDALLGLLQADRNLSPASELAGNAYCDILNHAVQRGFAAWMEDFDGAPCQLNLTELAADSRALLENSSSSDGREVSMTLFGRKCSTTGGLPGSASDGNGAGALLILLIPVMLVTMGRGYGPRHGGNHGS